MLLEETAVVLLTSCFISVSFVSFFFYYPDFEHATTPINSTVNVKNSFFISFSPFFYYSIFH
jgi:hypothetical protein